MGADLGFVIKTDFRQRNDKKATICQLQKTAQILNKVKNVDTFKVYVEEEYDLMYVYDSRGNIDFIHLKLFNGFWHFETSWRYQQYFEKNMWLRRLIFDYAKLFGQQEAWICNLYYSSFSDFWEDSTHTFEEWVSYCKNKEGKPIQTLIVQDVLNNEELFFDGDSIYHDSFYDLLRES